MYKSIPEYFRDHFREADLCFVSSHLKVNEITQMIVEGHRRFYNVCGLFLSNSIASDGDTNAAISELLWDERWIGTNEPTEDNAKQDPNCSALPKQLFRCLSSEQERGSGAILNARNNDTHGPAASRR